MQGVCGVFAETLLSHHVLAFPIIYYIYISIFGKVLCWRKPSSLTCAICVDMVSVYQCSNVQTLIKSESEHKKYSFVRKFTKVSSLLLLDIDVSNVDLILWYSMFVRSLPALSGILFWSQPRFSSPSTGELHVKMARFATVSLKRLRRQESNRGQHNTRNALSQWKMLQVSMLTCRPSRKPRPKKSTVGGLSFTSKTPSFRKMMERCGDAVRSWIRNCFIHPMHHSHCPHVSWSAGRPAFVASVGSAHPMPGY